MEPAHTPLEQSAAPLQPTAPNNRKRTIIALWLLIGPTALIVSSVVLYAIANFLFGAAAPTPDGAMFGESNPVQKIINVILFLIGAISVAAWLPGLIIGIVLLATRKK